MNTNNDYILIGGNLHWNTSSSSHISDGTIEVHGNIVGIYNEGAGIVTEGNAKVVLAGNGMQEVAFSKNAWMKKVVVTNPAIVRAITSIPCEEIEDENDRVSYGGSAVYGHVLTADEVQQDDMYIKGGKLDLNGHKLTVEGNLYVLAGDICINGGELEVLGDLVFKNTYKNSFSTGRMIMTNENDVVTIHGEYEIATSVNHTGLLTEGSIHCKGSFFQEETADEKSFVSTQNHTIYFDGDYCQEINMVYEESVFNNVVFNNHSAAGIYIINDMIANGNISSSGTDVYGILSINSDAVINGTYKGNLLVKQPYVLGREMDVEGDLYINIKGQNAVFDLNGYSLNVSNDINIQRGIMYVNGSDVSCENLNCNFEYVSYSCLKMNKPDDYVTVNGDFNYNSCIGKKEFLTDGTLDIKGDCNITVNNNNSFYATANHKIKFSGNAGQNVAIDNYGTGKEKFGIIEITNTSNEGVVFENAVIYDELITNGCKISIPGGGTFGYKLTADATIDSDLYVTMGKMDLNGHTLTINGDYIQSNGILELNGGTLNVTGDLRLQSIDNDDDENKTYGTGYVSVIMDNAADKIIVGNNLISSTEIEEGITNGTIKVNKDIILDESFVIGEDGKLIIGGTGSNRIDVRRGSSLSINNLEADNEYIGKITYSGDVSVNNSKLTMASLTDGEGYVGWTLQDDDTIDDSLTIIAGKLNLNGHTLQVNEDITFSDGQLVMEKPADSLIVGGNLFYNTTDSSDTRIIAGRITISGNLSQLAGCLITDGNCVINLNGDEDQTIYLKNYKSWIKELNIEDTGSRKVNVTGGLNAGKVTDNGGRLTSVDNGVWGYTLTHDTTIDDDLVLIGGKLNLNGYNLTVNGNVIHKSGDITIGTGALTINGNYIMYYSASYSYYDETLNNSMSRLIMNDSNSKVNVSGNMILASHADSKEAFKKGTLKVLGNLNQYVTADNMSLGDDFVIELCGDKKQSLSLSNDDTIRLSNLVVNNTSEQGVNIAGEINVSHSIKDISGNITGTIHVDTLEIIDTGVSCNVICRGSSEFTKDIVIKGNLRIEGYETVTGLNGHSLKCKLLNLSSGELITDGGSLTVSRMDIDYNAILNMTNEQDTILVNGDFNFMSYMSHEGKLTAGTLVIEGTASFYGNTSGNFVATGSHVTKFKGRPSNGSIVYVQNVYISNRGTHFNTLILTRPDSYYSFNYGDINIEDYCNQLVYDHSDIEVPTKVTGVSAQVYTTKTILTWNESSDDTAVAMYRVFRDNEQIAQVTSTGYTDNELAPFTTYIYRICAVDEAGNISEYSEPLSVTTATDTEQM